MKVDEIITFTLHSGQLALEVILQGRVTGIPTSEAYKGTIKVQVTKIISQDAKRRRFYRSLVGKSSRVGEFQIEACRLAEQANEGEDE